MAGNVWEWTFTVDRTTRFLYGGSRDNRDPSLVRAASQDQRGLTFRDVNVGFRCAREVM